MKLKNRPSKSNTWQTDLISQLRRLESSLEYITSRQLFTVSRYANENSSDSLIEKTDDLISNNLSALHIISSLKRVESLLVLLLRSSKTYRENSYNRRGNGNCVQRLHPISNHYRLRSKAAKDKSDKPKIEVDESYLVTQNAGEKGQGLFTTVFIKHGQKVIYYCGKYSRVLRPRKYPPDIRCLSARGNYTFCFKDSKSRTWCVDAYLSHGKARFINHGKGKLANVKPILDENGKTPQILFKAIRDILPNEELLYDYGERDREILKEFPFLK